MGACNASTWSLKQEDHKLETCLGCVGKHHLETKLEEKGLSLSDL